MEKNKVHGWLDFFTLESLSEANFFARIDFFPAATLGQTQIQNTRESRERNPYECDNKIVIKDWHPNYKSAIAIKVPAVLFDQNSKMTCSDSSAVGMCNFQIKCSHLGAACEFIWEKTIPQLRNGASMKIREHCASGGSMVECKSAKTYVERLL